MSQNTIPDVGKEKSEATPADLDQLLDSALEDFDDASLPLKQATIANSNNEDVSPVFNDAVASSANDNRSNDKSAENSQKENLLFGHIDVESTLNAVLDGIDDGNSSSEPVGQIIKDAMKKLTTNNNVPEDELAEMLENVNLIDDSMFFPLMENAFQTFLCKDILYPSMSEIKENYPAWLQKNKSKLSETELARFERQYKYIAEICAELEKETDSDSESVQKERFQKLLELMQKVNECGEPPKELLKDSMFDGKSGSPVFNSQEQCPVS